MHMIGGEQVLGLRAVHSFRKREKKELKEAWLEIEKKKRKNNIVPGTRQHNLILETALWDKYCYYPHFVNMGPETHRLSDLPKVTPSK